MSYIIAFVSYTDFTNKKYPVQCFRTDLKVNDIVLVRRTDGQLRFATVLKLEYLNWDCKGFILCKKSECSIDDHGNLCPPSNSAIIFGVATPEVFTKKLIDSGWILLRPHSATYRKILTKTNGSQIAYIFIRKNGIDLQILPISEEKLPIKSGSLYRQSLTQGKVVRHTLAHTTFNLYEGVLRFSDSFINNELNLERYFIPQGETDKRTDALKKDARLRKNLGEYGISDLYEACSDGNGGAAYLGDGIWITSGGGVYDWGR